MMLSSDGSMATRKWVAALQESIDYVPDEEDASARPSPGVGTPPGGRGRPLSINHQSAGVGAPPRKKTESDAHRTLCE